MCTAKVSVTVMAPSSNSYDFAAGPHCERKSVQVDFDPPKKKLYWNFVEWPHSSEGTAAGPGLKSQHILPTTMSKRSCTDFLPWPLISVLVVASLHSLCAQCLHCSESRFTYHEVCSFVYYLSLLFCWLAIPALFSLSSNSCIVFVRSNVCIVL